MALDEFRSEQEEVDERLFHDDEFIDKLSLSINPLDLCYLLMYRTDKNLISEQDMQEIANTQGITSSQQIDVIYDKLKERQDHNAGLKLLDCLRATVTISVTSLPIHHTILWITPSGEYAAHLIQTITSSSLLEEYHGHGDVFFWPVEHSKSSLTSSTATFLYRVCNIFTSFKVRLIVVFPESPGVENMKHTLNGSLLQWPNVSLLVYSGLASLHDPNYGVVMYRTPFCTDDLFQSLVDPSWIVNDFDELQMEFDKYRQMLWLAKLLDEIHKEERGFDSTWLKDVGWTKFNNENEKLLEKNLRDWAGGELRQYLLRTNHWSPDDSNIIGYTPSLALRQVSLEGISPNAVTFPPCNDVINFGVKDNPDHDPIASFIMQHHPNFPLLVTSALRQTELSTCTFKRLSILKCCKFTLQCVLFYLIKNINN
jgi:hypothetical protein